MDERHDQMQRQHNESKHLLAWQEHAPTYTLDQQILEARERMGERRWNELNADWETE